MVRVATRFLAVAIAVSVMGCAGAAAQDSGSQTPEITAPGTHRTGTAEDSIAAEQRRQLEKKRNEQRQADIKKDTDKLLELATELKQYVDQSNENTMSVDVIKKAEQIEKLAHSVKEKMKGP